MNALYFLCNIYKFLYKVFLCKQESCFEKSEFKLVLIALYFKQQDETSHLVITKIAIQEIQSVL